MQRLLCTSYFEDNGRKAAEVQKIPGWRWTGFDSVWHRHDNRIYESYDNKWNTSLGDGIHDWMKNEERSPICFWNLLDAFGIYMSMYLSPEKNNVVRDFCERIPQTIEMAPSPMATPGYRPVDRLAEPAFPWPMELSYRFWNYVQQTFTAAVQQNTWPGWEVC